MALYFYAFCSCTWCVRRQSRAHDECDPKHGFRKLSRSPWRLRPKWSCTATLPVLPRRLVFSWRVFSLRCRFAPVASSLRAGRFFWAYFIQAPRFWSEAKPVRPDGQASMYVYMYICNNACMAVSPLFFVSNLSTRGSLLFISIDINNLPRRSG